MVRKLAVRALFALGLLLIAFGIHRGLDRRAAKNVVEEFMTASKLEVSIR